MSAQQGKNIPDSVLNWINDEPTTAQRGRRRAARLDSSNQDKSPSKSPSKSPQRVGNTANANVASTRVRDGAGKIRIPWSNRELDQLRKGVEKYGVGQWKKIHENLSFPNRTPVDLKDKWRNLHSPRKPTLQEKRKFLMLDENGRPIGEFHNRYPRDAAIKAATKGYTFIRLRETHKSLVHEFKGWRVEEQKPGIMKFESSHRDTIWVGKVEKTGTKVFVRENY